MQASEAGLLDVNVSLPRNGRNPQILAHGAADSLLRAFWPHAVVC